MKKLLIAVNLISTPLMAANCPALNEAIEAQKPKEHVSLKEHKKLEKKKFKEQRKEKKKRHKDTKRKARCQLKRMP